MKKKLMNLIAKEIRFIQIIEDLDYETQGCDRGGSIEGPEGPVWALKRPKTTLKAPFQNFFGNFEKNDPTMQ